MAGIPRWRDVVDVALAGALAAGGLVELFTGSPEALGVVTPLSRTAGVIGVLGSAALLSLRRRRPLLLVGVFALWLVLGLVTRGEVPALFLGGLVMFWLTLYSITRHLTGRRAWASAAFGLVTVALADWTLPVLHSWNEALFDALTCGLAIVIGWSLRHSEERAVAEALRLERAETAARERATAAIAEERSRIARELHDVLGHSVSAMVVQAGAAEQVVDEDPEFVRRALATIRTVGTASLDEVRAAVEILHDEREAVSTAPRPGLADLDTLAATARASGLEVLLDIDAEASALTPGLELAVFRIVQESLTNIRKHSPATRAEVRVRATVDELSVEIHDNGAEIALSRRPARTGEASPTVGHGLIGMRERAHLYGGRVLAGPGPRGFAVHVVLPREVPA
jgi:signal transduction histidine kinase